MIKSLRFLIIASFLFLISCSEEIPYNVYFFNNTDYNMDELEVGFDKDLTISVTSGNMSKVITPVLTTKWQDFFVEGRMGIKFNKFSNQEDLFINEKVSHSGISLSRLERDSLNLIIITENTDSLPLRSDSTVLFKCEVVHKELKNNKNKIDSKNEVISTQKELIKQLKK